MKITIQNWHSKGENSFSTRLEAPLKWCQKQIHTLSDLSPTEAKISLSKRITTLFWVIVGALSLIPSSLLVLPSLIIRFLTACILSKDPCPKTDPKVIAYIYKMCKEFDELAQKHNIKYIADSGTLLGIVRHKGFIPWDDDADLQLLVGEETKIQSPTFQTELAAKGLKMAPHYAGWKLCPIIYPSFAKPYFRGSEERNFCFPFVDIFVTKVDPNHPDRLIIDIQANSTENREDTWCSRYYYTKDQVSEKTFQRRTFGPIQLPIPKNPQQYLDRAYDNWRNEARITFDHTTGQFLSTPIVVKRSSFQSGRYDKEIFKRKINLHID